MKKLIIVLALVFVTFISTSVLAYNELNEKCEFLSMLGAGLMSERQQGVSFRNVINKKSDFNGIDFSKNRSMSTLFDDIATMAYKTPVRNSNSQQVQEIVNFKNTVFTLCIRSR